MKKTTLSVLACLVSGAVLAVPTVSNVTVAQGADRLVTVSYTLDETAIVTVSFATNGVDIGVKNYVEVGGEVNRIIKAGDRKIVWRPDKTWPIGENVSASLTATVKAWALTCPPDYMVVDSRIAEPKMCVSFYPSVDALPEGGLTNRALYTRLAYVMRKIPAAQVRWRMGATSAMRTAIGHGTNNAYKEREVPHYVTLTKDYYMGIYPVTQHFARQYWSYSDGSAAAESKPLTKKNYVDYRGADLGADWPTNRPGHTAHDVDSGSFMFALRERSGVTDFDLPTMAQWEFAYRAGRGTNFYNGSDEITAEMNAADTLYAWDSTHASGVQQVGLLAPNPWGIYDMAGNVHEWCLDWFWQKWYNQGEEVTDPLGPEKNGYTTTRVMRGGSRSSGTMADFTASCCSMVSPSVAANTAAEYGVRVVCGTDVSALVP